MQLKVSNKGSALLQVMIVLIIFTVLGTSVLSLSMAEFWQGDRDNKKIQAYYYAVSGKEMIRRKFANSLAESVNSVPFYIYGSTNGITVVSGIYSGGDPVVDNSEILAKVTKTVTNTSDGSISNINIVSIGNVEGIKETVSFKFDYTSSLGSSAPIPPTTGTGGAIDAANPPGGQQPWYNISNGSLINSHDGHSASVPVLFNDGVTITKDNNSPGALTAPSMYFLNTPDSSLYIKKNMYLNIVANFVSFSASVTNGGERADLELDTYDSNIDGNSLITNGGISNGVSGTNYGVIYLGGKLSNLTLSSGYYFFPSGIHLFSQENLLIKISDVSKVGFTNPNSSITTETGSVSNGEDY